MTYQCNVVWAVMVAWILAAGAGLAEPPADLAMSVQMAGAEVRQGQPLMVTLTIATTSADLYEVRKMWRDEEMGYPQITVQDVSGGAGYLYQGAQGCIIVADGGVSLEPGQPYELALTLPVFFPAPGEYLLQLTCGRVNRRKGGEATHAIPRYVPRIKAPPVPVRVLPMPAVEQNRLLDIANDSADHEVKLMTLALLPDPRVEPLLVARLDSATRRDTTLILGRLRCRHDDDAIMQLLVAALEDPGFQPSDDVLNQLRSSLTPKDRALRQIFREQQQERRRAQVQNLPLTERALTLIEVAKPEERVEALQLFLEAITDPKFAEQYRHWSTLRSSLSPLTAAEVEQMRTHLLTVLYAEHLSMNMRLPVAGLLCRHRDPSALEWVEDEVSRHTRHLFNESSLADVLELLPADLKRRMALRLADQAAAAEQTDRLRLLNRLLLLADELDRSTVLLLDERLAALQVDMEVRARSLYLLGLHEPALVLERLPELPQPEPVPSRLPAGGVYRVTLLSGAEPTPVTEAEFAAEAEQKTQALRQRHSDLLAMLQSRLDGPDAQARRLAILETGSEEAKLQLMAAMHGAMHVHGSQLLPVPYLEATLYHDLVPRLHELALGSDSVTVKAYACRLLAQITGIGSPYITASVGEPEAPPIEPGWTDWMHQQNLKR